MPVRGHPAAGACYSSARAIAASASRKHGRAKITAPVTAKYLGRLAAADVFTADNAYVMSEAPRVDYGTLGPFADHP